MKRKLAIAVAGTTAVVAGAIAAPMAFADHVPEANDDPAFLQVYNANVENLPRIHDDCPGDWQDLIYYMKTQELMPDLYLVQQVNGSGDQLGDLGFLTDRMSKEFGQEYGGVIADPDPPDGPKACGDKKTYQTNAIIYRKARFEVVKDDDNTWQANAMVDGECRNNDQARTQAVKAQLRDKVANKTLTAASIHWPTSDHGGTDCAEYNAAETADEMTEDGYGSDLSIVGGDTNYPDVPPDADNDFRPWYRAINGELGGEHGFRDVVYSHCEATDDPGTCRREDNWTIYKEKRRFDFLFTRTDSGALPGADGVHTPAFKEGDAADEHFTGDDNELDYSDHRAIQARIHY